MRKTLSLFIMTCAAFVLLAGGRAAAQPPTLMDSITARPEITLYAEMLRHTGLDAVLRQPGPYTVFAPVDAALDTAFAAAGLDRTAVFSDPVRMRQIVNAHILTIRATTTDLRSFTLPATLATRGGDPLVVSDGGDGLRVNGGRIVLGDIAANNGMLHLTGATTLDPVATPAPDATPQAEAAYLRAGHFAADVGAIDVRLGGPTGAQHTLPGLSYTAQQGYVTLEPGVHTLTVVPSNLPDAPLLGPFQLPLAPDSALTVLVVGSLGRGTLNVQVFSEDYSTLMPGRARVTFFNAIEGAPVLEVRDGSRLPLFGGLVANGDPVFLDLPPGETPFFVGQAGGPDVMETRLSVQAGTAPLVVASGTWATGAVQLVPGPPVAVPGDDAAPTLGELLSDSSATLGARFETLQSLLGQAGLLDALDGPGPLVLFAPPDTVFTANPALLDQPDMAHVMRHHLYDGQPPVQPGPPVQAVIQPRSGVPLSLTVDATGIVTLQDGRIRVTQPSVQASNGVLVIIDGLLQP